MSSERDASVQSRIILETSVAWHSRIIDHINGRSSLLSPPCPLHGCCCCCWSHPSVLCCRLMISIYGGRHAD